MDKVDYAVDAASTFPRHYSGEVMVTLDDGRTLKHRVAVNRGKPLRLPGRDEAGGGAGRGEREAGGGRVVPRRAAAARLLQPPAGAGGRRQGRGAVGARDTAARRLAGRAWKAAITITSTTDAAAQAVKPAA